MQYSLSFCCISSLISSSHGGLDKKIDKLQSRFLWGDSANCVKKFYLVIWDLVCKAKREGGLSVLNLKNFNLTLIAKWWWRLLSRPEEWHNHCYGKNIVHERGPREAKIEISIILRAFGGVLGVRKTFCQGITYKVGKDDTIAFWKNT